MTTRNVIAARRFLFARKDTTGALLEASTLAHLNVQFKATAIDTGARTFEGLASVWGLDLGDDVMHKGAFKDTIAEWRASSDAMPLLNSHNHFDVSSVVGQMLDAKETADGLWTKWEVIDGPDGDAMLARLRPSQRTNRAPLSKMSIGYEPTKFDMEASDAARFGFVRNLRKVSLKEVSLVIFPMAPGARIDTTTVKSIDFASVKLFVAAATATEPHAVDDVTKLELRRLASRIGVLLAPSKAAPPPTPPAPETPPAPAEELDGDSSAPAVPPTPPQPPSEPPTDGAAAGASGDDASTAPPAPPAPEGKQEPAYLDDLMHEALEQRLQKTTQQLKRLSTS